MSELSSPAKNSKEILQGVYSLDLSLAELNELHDRASRLVGESPTWHTVQLQLSEGEAHRWFYNENNVTGWFISDSVSTCLTGWATFQLSIWASVIEVFSHCDHVNVTVDTQRRDVVITDGTYVITSYLPEQRAALDPYWEEGGRTVTVSSADLARIGRVLMTTPTSVEEQHAIDATVPFIQLTCTDGSLTGSRHWKNFDGGIFSIAVPALGQWGRTLEIFPFPLANEMYAADISGDIPVVLTELTHSPKFFTLNAGQWGYFVEVVPEKIHLYKDRLLAEIAAAGLDCDDEWVEGNTHILNVFVEEDVVAVSVVSPDGSEVDYLRADLVACKGVPRSDFIAREINSWNTSLEGIKIIQRGTDIVIRCECIAQHVSDLVSRLSLVQETAEGFRLLREVFA